MSSPKRCCSSVPEAIQSCRVWLRRSVRRGRRGVVSEAVVGHPGVPARSSRPRRCCLWRVGLLALVGLFGLAGSLAAAPRIAAVSLRFGGSPRLPVAEWAGLNYRLENPDSQTVTVRLSVRATSHARAVFEREVVLPPRTVVSGQELITADAAEEYIISLFEGSQRLERTQLPVRAMDQPQTAAVVVLNDSAETSNASVLVRLQGLDRGVSVTTMSARQAPHHWAVYGHTRLVLVLRPDYRELTSAQFEALTQHVQRGGAVLFAEPQGTLEAADTPWSGLLPVWPSGVRRVEAVPALEDWGERWWSALPAAQRGQRLPLVEREGIPCLESSERGDGVTTLRQDGLPLLRWQRCGLGHAGVVAIDPCQTRLTDAGAMVPLWNHILSYAPPVFSLGNLENSHSLPTVLGHLTGFRIPSAGAVAWVLYGYAIFLAVLLVGGFFWRRQALCWSLAAVSGLLLTAGLFAWALRQNATRPVAGAALLDLRAVTAESHIGTAVVSLFAKKDLQPAIRATGGAPLLRPLPSPARGKRREPLDAPLLVRHAEDRAGLAGTTVQALKPREFGLLYDRPAVFAEPITVRLGDGPLQFGDVGLPAGLAAAGTRSFLLLPGGLVPLSRDGARLTGLAGGTRLLETDPFLSDLGEYLSSGAFPRPAVMLLSAVRPGAADLPVDLPGLVADGFRASFLPVVLECGPGRLRLPPELVRLEAIEQSARSLARQDPREGSILRSGSHVMALEVILPALCADLRLDQVSVTVDYGNVGGNIQIEPRLTRSPLAGQANGVEAVWGGAVAASRREGVVYHFDDPRLADLIEPAYGRCRLLLEVSQRALVRDATEADRANRWRLNRLQVSLVGNLPEPQQTRRF